MKLTFLQQQIFNFKKNQVLKEKKMENPASNNQSDPVNVFILLGFPCSWEIQILLFSLFSVTYVLTLIGNLCIICSVWCDQHLHTPMYILLANFSFLEICSYTLVIRAVLKVPSAEGRHKAFSTCGSHLAVVSLFYGSIMVMYVSPTAGNPARIQKIVTLFYSVLTPFLNPMIYSLRNKEMKKALRKLLRIVRFGQRQPLKN
ncbi:olfactory receptor 11G2-like isoform X3 [Saccopteryx leptura]|uniref:olfactory receptor 11G2-like isoform X3 n=1 Tax=Saccopteryx leptura TaxID=249018 RepID=UPI00339BA9D5